MDSNKIIVTDASRLDYEVLKPDTSFSFRVQVANCELNKSSGKYDGPCLYDTAKVTIAVSDMSEMTHIVPCEGGSCSSCSGDNCVDVMDSICIGSNCQGVNPYDSVLTVGVKENSPTGYIVLNYAAFDDDVGTEHKDTLIATMKNTNNSGADSLFRINTRKINGEWRVVVSVKDGSKLDYERVKETHAMTIYVTDPDDPAGMRDSLRRIIKVIDVNEAPRARDADLKPSENLPKGSVIGKLDAVDPDTKHVKEFAHLEYSIIDAGTPFMVDSNIVIVNDPSKMDYELVVHEYSFRVQVANCELNATTGKYDGACLYDTARVTVDFLNINEVPKIIVDGPVPDGYDDSDSICIAHCDTTNRGVTSAGILTIGVRENSNNPNGSMKIVSPTDMVLFQYHVVDEDSSHVAGAKVSWFDAATTIPSVSTKGTDLFKIEYSNGVITVRVKDEKRLDYESLRNATSRDDSDPEYTMGIVVTDPYGLADTLYRKIRIIDMNEMPLFEVWPITIVENNRIGDSLAIVEHPSDIDSLSGNSDLYDNGFKMTGDDTSLFWLDKDPTDLMRAVLRAKEVLDCENGEYICGQDSLYWIELIYGDTTLKTVYSDVKIPVKLIDLNEPPEILTDSMGVDENSPKGTVVDTVKWFDVDRFDTAMDFKIVKDPTGCFDIGRTTGIVAVKKDNCAGLDYEKNPNVTINVSVSDMVEVASDLIAGSSITVVKSIKVNIHDVDEPASITDTTISEPESISDSTEIDTVRATEPGIDVESDPAVADTSKVPDEKHDAATDTLKHDSVVDTLKHDSFELSEDTFAKPSFRVKMVGLFKFVIVMDDDAPASLKSYAVMDLQGRVVNRGKITSTETLVPALNRGSYVVRVGLGMRRVNVH